MRWCYGRVPGQTDPDPDTTAEPHLSGCAAQSAAPMGCRTGNYLLLNGDYESKDIVPLMIETFEFIRDFEGEVPGASAKDCGNYLDMNLPMAKYLAGKFLDEVLYDIKPDRLIYPQ